MSLKKIVRYHSKKSFQSKKDISSCQKCHKVKKLRMCEHNNCNLFICNNCRGYCEDCDKSWCLEWDDSHIEEMCQDCGCNNPRCKDCWKLMGYNYGNRCTSCYYGLTEPRRMETMKIRMMHYFNSL